MSTLTDAPPAPRPDPPRRRPSPADRVRDGLRASEAARLAACVAAAIVLWPVLAAALPHGLPAGIVLLGVVYGSLTGLTALGLVLVYRATRILNFAQAALGSAAASLAIMLFLAWHWNYFVCFALGLVLAAGVGAAVDRVVIQRFFWAPRLILTLATIGLAQILGGVEAIIPTWFGQPLITTAFRTPLSAHFSVEPVLFNGNHVVLLIAVPAAVAALGWFLQGTDVGKGIRASAENAERAMLLGVPVRRLSTVVWAIAAALSALGVLLLAPLQARPPTVLAGPAMLLPAFAAAVVARMEHLPRAFLAGVALGVIGQATFWSSRRGALSDVVFFVVVLVALVAQRHTLSRRDDTASSWVAAQETPPVPEELAALPEVRWGRRVVLAGAAAAALSAPAFLSASQLLLLGTIAVTYAIVGVSLVVLTGWAGQISLGQFAIAGAGAVVCANAVAHRVDLLAAILAAMAAGGLLAVAVGVPALRIRGLFLGVTTLALSVAAATYFLNPTYFSSILPGSIGRPMLLERFDLNDETTLFYFALALLTLAVAMAWGIRRGWPGRVMVAVRDNEPAAQSRGVPTTAVKLMTFGVAGALAGMAGALHVLVVQGINFGTYSPAQSFEAFSMVVIGGLTSVSGAVLGAVALRWAQYVLSGGLQMVVTGAGVLFLLLVFPGGLGQVALRGRDAYLRRVAVRRRIVVPSLFEDRAVAAQPSDAVLLEDLLSGSDLQGALAVRPTDPAGHEVEQLRARADELQARLAALEALVGAPDTAGVPGDCDVAP